MTDWELKEGEEGFAISVTWVPALGGCGYMRTKAMGRSDPTYTSHL